MLIKRLTTNIVDKNAYFALDKLSQLPPINYKSLDS